LHVKIVACFVADALARAKEAKEAKEEKEEKDNYFQ